MHPTNNCDPPIDLPGTDAGSSAAWRAFMRTLHDYRRLMSRAMTDNAMPPGQIFALREIGHDDGVTQRDLAERLRISRPTLTVMLQKMEKAGVIERRADEADQRYTRIHLTPAGIAEHKRMHGFMGDVVSQVMGLLSDADRDQLTRLLGLIHDSITAALETSPAANQEAAE